MRWPRGLLTIRAARRLAGLAALIALLALFSTRIASEVATTSAPPEPPSALLIVGVTSTGAYLSWQDNSSSEEGFLVYMIGQTEAVARVGPNITTAEVTGLECQSDYQFRVAAMEGTGSALSEVLLVATGVCTTPPDQNAPCPEASGDAAPAESPPATAIPATAVPSPRPSPTPTATGGFPARLTVPDGYTVYVTSNGCLVEGTCPLGEHPVNYYWAPTRTAVVCPEQTPWTLRHEACHAHQHLTILEELGKDAGPPYDLHEWLVTGEARDWGMLVTTAWPNYGHWASEPSAHNALEDFAISCGLYFTNPQLLHDLDPLRFNAIEAAFS